MPNSFTEQLNKNNSRFSQELKNIRTGRANPEMISDILVEAYDTKTPLTQVAGISSIDAKTLAIEPWDKSLVKEIERAINMSGRNLSPSTDGDVIRISIPETTEETRKKMVKQIGEKLEFARVSVRRSREEQKKSIESDKKIGNITEDDRTDNIRELDRETKEAILKLEEIAKQKEQEIMTI